MRFAEADGVFADEGEVAAAMGASLLVEAMCENCVARVSCSSLTFLLVPASVRAPALAGAASWSSSSSESRMRTSSGGGRFCDAVAGLKKDERVC